VLGVTTKRVVLGYVGRLKTLGMEKGVETVLQAVKKDSRFFALIVGGPASDLSFYKERAAALGLGTEDVLFTGEVPAKDVPAAIAACDIAVMPFPDLPHYRLHMSPLKMFEYMAAGRPIVTSDLPTIRDVLSEDTAWFFRPGDTDDFLRAAREVAGHPDRAAARTKAATELVKKHTWEERMKRVLGAIR
jgi:glycosyltransferase involved in cell wall biosynthesis